MSLSWRTPSDFAEDGPLATIWAIEGVIGNLATSIFAAGASAISRVKTLHAMKSAVTILVALQTRGDSAGGRSLGEKIAAGHTGQEHLWEFADVGIYDLDSSADLINDVIDEALKVKQLSGQRTAYCVF